MIKQHREMEPGELVAAGSLQHQSVDSSVGRDLALSNLQLPLFLFAKLPGWKLQAVTLLCGLHPCPAPPSGISTTANCSLAVVPSHSPISYVFLPDSWINAPLVDF